MKFDYNLKNYDFRLIFYMVVLNILGVVIMRSESSGFPSDHRFLCGTCDLYRTIPD